MKKIKILGFEINRIHIISLVLALLIGTIAYFFVSGDLLYFILGIDFIIAFLPFIVSIIITSVNSREKEEMFLEFSRNLVESVKTGTPISKSILNIRSKDYGKLNPYINKLANQISLGIPIQIAFQTFARDLDIPSISRAINIISESEKAGGKIEDILDSVVKSITEIENLKKERKAAISSLVVQGYIIFLIFIVIMVVMQFKILPIVTDLGNVNQGIDTSQIGNVGISLASSGSSLNAKDLARPFLWLLIVQGFFAGLVIGKLTEGKILNGLKHSFVLVTLSLLINTGFSLFF